MQLRTEYRWNRHLGTVFVSTMASMFSQATVLRYREL